MAVLPWGLLLFMLLHSAKAASTQGSLFQAQLSKFANDYLGVQAFQVGTWRVWPRSIFTVHFDVMDAEVYITEAPNVVVTLLCLQGSMGI